MVVTPVTFSIASDASDEVPPRISSALIVSETVEASLRSTSMASCVATDAATFATTSTTVVSPFDDITVLASAISPASTSRPSTLTAWWFADL